MHMPPLPAISSRASPQGKKTAESNSVDEKHIATDARKPAGKKVTSGNERKLVRNLFIPTLIRTNRLARN